MQIDKQREVTELGGGNYTLLHKQQYFGRRQWDAVKKEPVAVAFSKNIFVKVI